MNLGRSDHAHQMQEFIDALRGVLRLRPLYRLGRVDLETCYERRAFADMLIVSGDGNRQVRAFRNPDERRRSVRNVPDSRELAAHQSAGGARRGVDRGATRLNGQRVGASFTSAKYGKAK